MAIEQSPQNFLKEVISSGWKFATRGWRIWITYPLFFIVIFFLFILPKINATIEDTRQLKSELDRTAFLTRDEEDVADEWVALIREYASKENVEVDKEGFLNALKLLEYRNGAYLEDVYVVRSLYRKDHYWLVIDMGRGAASEKIVQGEINGLKDYSWKYSRKKKSPLVQYLDKIKPVLYDLKLFKASYGKLLNVEENN